MQWVTNQYYPLVKSQTGAIPAVSSLLHAYPLTGSCLETLGNKLLQRVEFGFFTTGAEIIRQGESGKDLFLLCSGIVDVLVNGQVVVDMESPALLGDKAIVEPESKRSATIRVGKGEDVLVIKIPMGLFIRNFNDSTIPDKEFSQELSIFCNVFMGIQERLFHYIYLQQNLWEEVNTTLGLLNGQLIAKGLDNKKDMNWDAEIWNMVKEYIAKNIKFVLPDHIPLNANTFRDILWQIVENKFPRNAFKGKDADYLTSKHLLMRSWLTQIGEYVAKELPPDKLPFHIGDIELFNPRNYHMRMSKLLRSAENKFPPKQTSSATVVESKSAAIPAISSFFGKGERSNEFEITRYFSSFEQIFSIKHPNRMMSQIGQRTALITAECENQFNASVATMQKFLEKAKSKSIAPAPKQEVDTEAVNRQIQKHTSALLRGFTAYNRQPHMITDKHLGETMYVQGMVPTIDELIKCSAARSTRAELERAFQFLQKMFVTGNLPPRFIKRNMFICESQQSDIIPYKELKKHYWMPISRDIRLMNHSDPMATLEPGTLIGGPGWEREQLDSDESGDDFYLKMPERRKNSPGDHVFLLFLFPSTEFGWELDNETSPERFLKEYLPPMQWFLNKHVEYLSILLKHRDHDFQQWFEIVQVVHLEKMIKEFENTQTLLTPQQVQGVGNLLKTSIGLELDPQTKVYSSQLSKKIYNHILRKMGEDFPQMAVEERSNKSYTKWRFVLSEITKSMDQFGSGKNDAGVYTPKPIFDIISTELQYLAATYLGEQDNKFTKITEQHPDFNFTGMLQSASNMASQKKIAIFRLATKIFEEHICQLIQEAKECHMRLEKIKAQRPQSGGEADKLEMIKGEIEKLTQILKPAR
ncbi:MAG: cyclic nucleotide-binding domain-containing protein [SAR324 cluster bacterium]|nr:cyclic nucleotide-binding domain-containing protein [SAR324 cluster bacterium]